MPLSGYPIGGPPTTKAPVDETCDGTLHLMTNFNVEHFPVWQYSRKCNKECTVYKASLHDFKGEHKIFYKPLFFNQLHNPDGNRQPEVVDLTGDTEDQEKIATNHGYVGSDGHVTGDRFVEHNGIIKKESFLRITVPFVNDETDEAKCSVEAEGTAEVRESARSGNCSTGDEVARGATVTESDEAERPTGASASGDTPEDGGVAVDELQPETNRLPKVKHNSGTNSFVHAGTQTAVYNQPTIATNSPNTGLSQSNTSSSQQPSKVKRYPRPSTGRRPMRVVGRVIENLFAGRYRHRFLHHRQHQRRRNKVVGSYNSSTTDSLCGRTNVIKTGPGVTNGASHGPSSNTINTQGGSNNAGSTSTSNPNVSQNGSGPGVTNGASHAPNTNTTQGDSSNSGCCPIMPMHMTIPMVKTFTNTILITDDTHPNVTVTVGNTHVSTTSMKNGSRPTVTTNDGHLSTAIIRNDSSPNTTVTRNGCGQVASITRNSSGPTSTITRTDCGPRATLTRNDSGISATITRSDSEPSVITNKRNSNPSVITKHESASSTIITKNISGMSTTIIKNSNVQNGTITGNGNDQSTTIPITFVTGKVGGSNATTAINRCGQTEENDLTSEQQRATITENDSGQRAIVTVNGSGSSTASTINDNFAITSFGVCATNSAVGKKCNTSINSRSENVMSTIRSKNGSCTALQRSDSGLSSTNCRNARVTNAYKHNIVNNTVSDNSKCSNVAAANARYGNGNFTIENIMASPKEYYSKQEPISDGCSTITGTVSCEGKNDSKRKNSASSNNNVDASTKKLRSLSAIHNSDTYESDTSVCGGVGDCSSNDNDCDDVDDDDDAVTVVDSDDTITVADLDNHTDTVAADDGEGEDDGDDDEDSGAVADSDDCDDEIVGDGSDHYEDGGDSNNNNDDDNKGEINVCSNKDTLMKGINNSVQSLVDYKSNDTSDSSGSFNESNDASEGEDYTSTNISGCNKGASVELSAPPAIPRDSYNDNDVSSQSNGRNKRNNTSVKDNVAKRIKLESAGNLDFQRMQDERIIDYIDLTKE